MYLRGLGARRESGTDGAEGQPSGQRSPRGTPPPPIIRPIPLLFRPLQFREMHSFPRGMTSSLGGGKMHAKRQRQGMAAVRGMANVQ